MTPRVLILMRHGKSAYPDGVSDHDRPLAPRGQREAGLAGDWLRSTRSTVDQVLCSTSTRTRETLIETGIAAPTSFEPRIYGGSAEQLFGLIRTVDDTASTVLILGHAPGLPWAAWQLGANHDSDAAQRMSTKFPTSAMAVVRIDRPWMDIDTGCGELVDFHVPR